MNTLKSLLGAIALASALPALADTTYQTTYDITPTAGMPEITNIMLAESGSQDLATGFSLTWPFSADAYPSGTRIVNPFPTDAPTVTSLLIGLVHDLPNDAPGQEHIVLFMDPTAAANVQHIAWGTVFLDTLEDRLIQQLHGATANLPFEDPIVQEGLDGMFDFVGNAARNAQVGPNGTSGSTWFTTGGAFSVVAWSDAQLIATGVSSVEAIAAVPEPQSLVLMLAGLGVVGWLSRRRRA